MDFSEPEPISKTNNDQEDKPWWTASNGDETLFAGNNNSDLFFSHDFYITHTLISQHFFYNTNAQKNNHTLICTNTYINTMFGPQPLKYISKRRDPSFGIPHFCGDTLVSLYIKILFLL